MKPYYISVSNVKVEEVIVEQSDREFSVICLPSGGRIRIRNSRLHSNREELEKKLGLCSEPNRHRPPSAYFH